MKVKKKRLENLSLIKGRDTSLMLLDEADSGINEKRLGQVYGLLAGDAAVVLVTHRDIGKILAEYPTANMGKDNLFAQGQL